MRHWFSTVALAAVVLNPGWSWAHPPGKRVLGPSRADVFLKEAARARRAGDAAAESAALLSAKRALAQEGRFACCIAGGCSECVRERVCACAESLFNREGVCADCLAGLRAGGSRWPDLDPALLFLQPMGPMGGITGPWPMQREGSGTSWLPDASPMYGWMFPREIGGWQAMAMGSLAFVATEGTGPRSAADGAAATNLMLMLRKGELDGPTAGWRLMVSADSWTNSGRGMPLLFQTGETWMGEPLVDRQHPHDAVMEFSHTRSVPVGKENRFVATAALVGEPAFGPAAYQHRPSAWDFPVAPIAHHVFEGSHISHGVGTVGWVWRDKLRLESSRFNGTEPDEARKRIDSVRWNADALRLSWNPSPSWSVQVSRGWLPGEAGHGAMPHGMRKTSSSVHWSGDLSEKSVLSTMFAVAREVGHDGGTNAMMLEANCLQGRQSTFGRWETVDKSGLVPGVTGSQRVSKWTVGRSWTVTADRVSESRLGVALDGHQVPGALQSAYGKSPLSFRLFLVWRPARMN